MAWPNPAAALRARIDAWFQSRLPRADTLLLTQRNVYILPTRAGHAREHRQLQEAVETDRFFLRLGARGQHRRS